jgi:predicted nucleotidyltransferase
MTFTNFADENLAILSIVANSLGPLNKTLVFVGGCVVGLLVTNVRAQPIRATRDVDLVAHVTSLSDYHALEEEFRALGFTNDLTPDAPACRWRRGDVIVDLMPTDETILGFSNRWYVHAVETATLENLNDGTQIKLINAPTFIATKIEAFKGRGNNDYLLSHDLEDVVTIIDGRNELISEIRESAVSLRAYLREEFSRLLSTEKFVQSLAGYLPSDPGSQQRLPYLRQRLRSIASTEF